MVIKRKYFSSLLLSIGITVLGGNTVTAQPLTIDECYTLARANYPLIKQVGLIGQTKEYTLENLSKGYLPQISVNGQVTYQSAVTSLPVSLPNINIPSVSKDQYKLYTEVQQPITDIISVNVSKELAAANTTIEEQTVEVTLYQLKERINNLYFGILLADARIWQMALLKKDIQKGIDRTNAAIKNGVALKSSVQTLQAEMLQADQNVIELQAARAAYAAMLSMFIHREISEKTEIVEPAQQMLSATVNRPELRLYDVQKDYLQLRKKQIDAGNIPHLGIFAQGGYGRPALNMLSNEFDFYYVGGLRLNWSLSGYYTARKQKSIISLNQNTIDIQKETFLFNTNLSMTQQRLEASKYLELIKTDNEIIALRSTIKSTANNQLESGTITANDYLINVNAEDKAKQNLLLHKLQLLMTQYNHKITSGN